MKQLTALALFAASIVGAVAPAEAVVLSPGTFVSSRSTAPTLLGAVLGGKSYSVTATGNSDLFDSFNSGKGLTFDADGVPTYEFPNPYSPFNPDGLDYDPTGGMQAHCVGGAGLNCGSLIGQFVAIAARGPATYFALGSSANFTAPTDGLLYGLVNDIGDYSDNGAEGFNVQLNAVNPVSGVPEPASWAMMIVGLGLAGGAMRRRKHQSIATRLGTA